MNSDLASLHGHADRLLGFLLEHKSVISTHLVTFFSEKHWELVDESWLNILSSLNTARLAEIPFGLIDRVNWPSTLCNYLTLSQELKLPGLFCSKQIDSPDDCTSTNHERHHILDKGISVQKRIEVDGMAVLVSGVAQAVGAKIIVDIGAGSGYLATTLAHRFGFHVIAIDGSSHQIMNLRKREEDYLEYEKKRQKKTDGSMYIMENDIGQEDTERLLGSIQKAKEEMIQDCPMEKWDTGVVVVGLHTCGNLAPSSLKIFKKDDRNMVKAVISIGCCYNLLTSEGLDETDPRVRAYLTDQKADAADDRILWGWGDELYVGNGNGKEEVEKDTVCKKDKWTISKDEWSSCVTPRRPLIVSEDSKIGFGFPLSGYVASHSNNFVLGSKARNLALEPSSRWTAENLAVGSDGLPIALPLLKNYWRACLQLYLLRKFGEDGASRIVIGRQKRTKKFGSFLQYAIASMSHAEPSGVVLAITKEECFESDLVNIEAECRPRITQFIAYSVIRAVLGPCLESLILIDRGVYLMEGGGVDVDLIPAFDSYVSPRNYAVIGKRK